MDSPDEDEVFDYNEDDPSKWHNNCLPEIGKAMPEEDRRKAADLLGPNWATIMSGLGDQ
jgi:hypothetical protein